MARDGAQLGHVSDETLSGHVIFEPTSSGDSFLGLMKCLVNFKLAIVRRRCPSYIIVSAIMLMKNVVNGHN